MVDKRTCVFFQLLNPVACGRDRNPMIRKIIDTRACDVEGPAFRFSSVQRKRDREKERKMSISPDREESN